jgi:hypothetical protein
MTLTVHSAFSLWNRGCRTKLKDITGVQGACTKVTVGNRNQGTEIKRDVEKIGWMRQWEKKASSGDTGDFAMDHSFFLCICACVTIPVVATGYNVHPRWKGMKKQR